MTKLSPLAALFALAAPAAAEVVICATPWTDASCYLAKAVQPAFASELPYATLFESTRLFVTSAGRPAARISWFYRVRWGLTAAADAVVGRPDGAVHRVVGRFGGDLRAVVCGAGGVFGARDAAGQFVQAGGVVIYPLRFSHAELASVAIDTCEAT